MKPPCAATILILLLCMFPAVSVGQTWTTTTNPPPGDVGSILLLRDGSVMAHNESATGNITEAWYRLTPVITANGQLDYVDGVWSTTGPLPTGYQPYFFSSAVLPDGRLIVEGGEYCGMIGNNECLTAQGAIYDPNSQTWTPVAPPDGWSSIGDAPSAVLPTGLFMQGDCCDPGSHTALLDAPSLSWPDYWQGRTDGILGETGWTLMTNDKVLMVETWGPHGGCSQVGYELYDPTTSQWSCGQGQVPGQLYQDNTGEIGAAIMMYNGFLLQIGANDDNPSTGLYNPAADSWIAGPTPPNNLIQTDGPAAVEPNGNVLSLMGPFQQRDHEARAALRGHRKGSHAGVCQAVEYSPPSNYNSGLGVMLTLTPQPKMCNRGFTSVPGKLLVLPSGQVMLTYNTSTVEIFTPQNQTPWPNVAPLVTWVSDNYTFTGGNTYSLVGYQLNGISQGSTYGDDFQNASNYPLITLQDPNNPQNMVFAATANDFDPVGLPYNRPNSIAPNHLTGTTFTVPVGSCSGNYSLTVITNGIPSAPVPVSVSNIQCTN